jgi:soluble lytic murein transglycosylase-like protein
MSAMKVRTILSLVIGLGVQVSACADCWRLVGAKYAVEPELLYAIAIVESGLRPDATNANKNGSRDLGLMQINSMHMPGLYKRGITEQRLLDEPCLSIDVGASILVGFMSRYGYNWTAVGAYNAGNAANKQEARLRYARKVWGHYRKLVAQSAEGGRI